MIPWDAFRDSNPLCYAVALVFLFIAISYIYEWRADELSYRLTLPLLELEGTLKDIEPRPIPMWDIGTSSWVLAIAFVIASLVLRALCDRLRLSA